MIVKPFRSAWYFDSVIISVLLGRPGKRHPVLGQALACLFGSFQHFLSSLQTQSQNTHKINTQRTEHKDNFHTLTCQQTSVCYYFVNEKTLFISDVLMYGSALCVMPFCSTFSIRATRKISAWGLVTEKIPCRKKRDRVRRPPKIFSYNLSLEVQYFAKIILPMFSYINICLEPVDEK